MKSEFLNIMIERGFVSDCTDMRGLDDTFSSGPVTGYVGYDATAKSLHVGHLVNIMMLRWFQKTGNRPVILMGGGTTMVGDPSFRSSERPMLSETDISDNIAGIMKPFRNVLDMANNDALMINNSEWLGDVGFLSFLREVGAHFSVNKMLSFSSVKDRMADGGSLSFLEFSYMLLQAFDFWKLNEQHGCVLQMGGSDQWGNIVNGIELIRKKTGKESFGLTTPLIETSDGKKMGKSGGKAVWLNPDMTSPFEFWQFWRNVDDKDVGRFLLLFTELSVEECHRLGGLSGAKINEAKVILANEVTKIVHGAEESEKVRASSESAFGSENGDTSSLPMFQISGSIELVELVKMMMNVSGKEAKRLIDGGAVRIEDIKLLDKNLLITADKSGTIVFVGKKCFRLTG